MIQSPLLILADVFTPPLAPVVLLAFVGTGFLVFIGFLAAAVAAAARRFGLARVLGGSALAVAVLYGSVLLGVALVSRERTLERDERKYFCEMDCHLAYSVTAVTKEGGNRYAVTVRTWFDPSTIASFRGNGPLTPNPRTVYLVDASGRRYAPSRDATRNWERTHGPSTPLDRVLTPGESYSTTFVFELPEMAVSPRFFIGDPFGPETVLIGHENSPLHKKAYFALEPGSAEAR
jgi:hypothetical protein